MRTSLKIVQLALSDSTLTLNLCLSDVSSDLAEKLLTPTPGTLVLMKHLTQEPSGMKRAGEEGNTQPKTEKSATQLLFEHKQKLALERRNQVLMEKQNSTVPLLGKGFGAGVYHGFSAFISIRCLFDINVVTFFSLGDMINLNSPKLASQMNALDRAKARAKALLEAKGKPLEKSDPNLERMARKRKSTDSEKKRSENVAKALMGDDQKYVSKKKMEEKEREKVRSQCEQVLQLEANSIISF